MAVRDFGGKTPENQIVTFGRNGNKKEWTEWYFRVRDGRGANRRDEKIRLGKQGAALLHNAPGVGGKKKTNSHKREKKG